MRVTASRVSGAPLPCFPGVTRLLAGILERGVASGQIPPHSSSLLTPHSHFLSWFLPHSTPPSLMPLRNVEYSRLFSIKVCKESLWLKVYRIPCVSYNRTVTSHVAVKTLILSSLPELAGRQLLALPGFLPGGINQRGRRSAGH